MTKTLSLALMLMLGTVAAQADDNAARLAASRAAVQKFAGQLQGELQAAIQAGGPAQAIEVCHQRAPQIAADISAEQGFKVARTSLKARNPANTPDAWEREVLTRFEQRQSAGEDVTKLEYTETVGREFRYMKAIAIPAGAPCLLCHGQNVDPKLAARIKALYPQDAATGYREGDIRGAFSVRQAL